MRLDASKEFEVFTKMVANIKMQAALVGDTDVLVDMMQVLVQLVANMFATLPTDVEPIALRAFLENKYSDILLDNNLSRTSK